MHSPATAPGADAIRVRQHSASGVGSVNSNNSTTIDFSSISLSGYKAVGIVGYQVGTAAFLPYRLTLSSDGSKARVSVRNTANSAQSAPAVTISVLYVRSDLTFQTTDLGIVSM